jgi:flavin-dependent dehydrogenase
LASHEQNRGSATSSREWDAIIIGAGMSGMYQLYRLRRLGLRVRVLEAGTGVGVNGFANMMMLMGPHTALGNIPRSIEYNVDWVTGLIRFARASNLTRVEATAAGVATWTDHVKALGAGMPPSEVDSWMTGINSKVDGKQTRTVARYSGSAPAYRARCDAVIAARDAELSLASSHDSMKPIAPSSVIPGRWQRGAKRPVGIEPRISRFRVRFAPRNDGCC